MSQEVPKLFTSKPKKAQLKKFHEQQKSKDFASPTSSTPTASSASASSAAAAASYKMGSPPPPPPPQPPKESFARRYKFLWPLLLTVNLAVGAYLFIRTKKKDADLEEAIPSNVPPTSSTSTETVPAIEQPMPAPAISEPVKLRKPIPENQQRELFKWMLEEKRKIKPRDAEEKKRIEEEKTILKQFIRAKSIPTI